MCNKICSNLIWFKIFTLVMCTYCLIIVFIIFKIFIFLALIVLAWNCCTNLWGKEWVNQLSVSQKTVYWTAKEQLGRKKHTKNRKIMSNICMMEYTVEPDIAFSHPVKYMPKQGPTIGFVVSRHCLHWVCLGTLSY